MRFYSSRNRSDSVSFENAILLGLASDGGLFCPERIPDLSEVFKTMKPEDSFPHISAEVLYHFLEKEIDRSFLSEIIDKAFTFAPKITTLSENISILELFHGPSCAFKDFGACFLAASMESFLKGLDKKALILTATSGDTGSAVAQAFYGKKNIDVVILYPSGRVSPLQEKQLTTLGGNIQALEIKGSFDDCQRMVKESFVDNELKSKINLSSANSINLGRLIPQSFYYIWSRIQDCRKPFVFCVPSGNFGNLTAGLYAESWGLPIDRFIAATNINDVVPEYLEKGIYTPRSSVLTYSNAMDVGAPSNFERMEILFGGQIKNFRKKITGIKISDAQTLETIQKIDKKFDYLTCPHTAVGIAAAEKYLEANQKHHIMVLSTAHPGKFVEIVKKATGKEPSLPEALLKLINRKKESVVLDNSTGSLKQFLLDRYI